MLFGNGVLLLVAIAFWLYAIVDAFTTPAESVRSLPKTVWVIILLLFMDLGAIAWFFFGRARKGTRTRVPRSNQWTVGGSAAPASRRKQALAPDDDPEFLMQLRDDLRKKRDSGDTP